jgi:hypothetical protein
VPPPSISRVDGLKKLLSTPPSWRGFFFRGGRARGASIFNKLLHIPQARDRQFVAGPHPQKPTRCRAREDGHPVVADATEKLPITGRPPSRTLTLESGFRAQAKQTANKH